MKNSDQANLKRVNDSLILAALSVPLNNKVTNFEQLNFTYVPPNIKSSTFSSTAREEIAEISTLLHINGVPSRSNIIHYLNVESIAQQGCSKHVAELFVLIEQEVSPFTISKKAKAALALL
jgi:hypothetical protein